MFPDFHPTKVPVYEGETVKEFCARVSGSRGETESERGELLWGTILLPEFEILQALTSTKPWQIDLKKGAERLLMRVPRGCGTTEEMLKYMKIAEKKPSPPPPPVEAPPVDARPKKRARTNKAESADDVSEDLVVAGLLAVAEKKPSGDGKQSEREATVALRVDRRPRIRVAIVREAMEKLFRQTTGRRMRSIMDFYEHDASPVERPKNSRQVQVCERYTLSLTERGEARIEDEATEEDLELVAQLNALATSGKPTRSKADARARALRVDEEAALPNELLAFVPTTDADKTTKVVIRSGTFAEAWATTLASQVKPQVDMGRVRCSTFACFYYTGLVSEALNSVSLLPPSMLHD